MWTTPRLQRSGLKLIGGQAICKNIQFCCMRKLIKGVLFILMRLHPLKLWDKVRSLGPEPANMRAEICICWEDTCSYRGVLKSPKPPKGTCAVHPCCNFNVSPAKDVRMYCIEHEKILPQSCISCHFRAARICCCWVHIRRASSDP